MKQVKLKDMFTDYLGDYTFDFEFIATLAYNLYKRGQDLERIEKEIWCLKIACDDGDRRPADALTRNIKEWVTYKVTTGADVTSVNETKFDMHFLRGFALMMLYTMPPDTVYEALKETICNWFDKKDKKIPDVERYAVIGDFRRSIEIDQQRLVGRKRILHNTQNV